MMARRTLAATLILAACLGVLNAAGWAADHAPGWLALIVFPAIGVIFYRLFSDGER